ncbi:MAG TPA: hypothetical protein VNZ26_07025, partial [Vicinamibacterales bacterium]|nr:hypothetical protein [Vicinamibacterales bacterium]
MLAVCSGALIPFWVASHTERLFAQTVFRGGVDLVEVDAIVLDASGRQVSGLTSKDFTLSVDGAPREIESIEYINSGQPTNPVSADPESSPARAREASRPPAARHVVFVVDEGNISAGAGRDAAVAAARLLDRFGSSDRVALLSIPSGPSVDFTSDHESIRSALNRVVGRAGRGTVAADYSLSWTETFAFDVGQTTGDRREQEAVFQRNCAPGMTHGESCEDGVRAEAQGRLEANRERGQELVAGLGKLFQALAKMQGPKA